MFCLLSQALNKFDTSLTGSELVRFHWYVSSCEKLVISQETCVDTPNLFTESGEFTCIEPVELVNSLTEPVKTRVLVCWVVTALMQKFNTLALRSHLKLHFILPVITHCFFLF